MSFTRPQLSVQPQLTERTARVCVAALSVWRAGCALLALNVPEARSLVGPVVPGAHGGPHGAHVPGTSFVLDPERAAFCTGALVSWLDYNDCWLGAEWCVAVVAHTHTRTHTDKAALDPVGTCLPPLVCAGSTRRMRCAPFWRRPTTRPMCVAPAARRRC